MATDPVVPEYAPILVGRVGMCPHDDQATHDYPTLMQLMLPRYRDDRCLTREAGSLTVKVDGSLFRVTITCPTEGLVGAILMREMSDLLLHIERALSEGRFAWTPTYDAKKRARRGLDKSV